MRLMPALVGSCGSGRVQVYGGSPAVSDGLVFVAGGTDPHSTTLSAYDATTGTLRWKATQPAVFFPGDDAPTVAAGRVFLGLRDTDIVSFDEFTGALLWRVTLPDPGYFGVLGHVAVANGLVIAPVGGAGVYAFDSITGRLRWSFSPVKPIGVGITTAIAVGTVYVTFHGTLPDGHTGDQEGSAAAIRWHPQVAPHAAPEQHRHPRFSDCGKRPRLCRRWLPLEDRRTSHNDWSGRAYAPRARGQSADDPGRIQREHLRRQRERLSLQPDPIAPSRPPHTRYSRLRSRPGVGGSRTALHVSETRATTRR